MTWVHDEDGGGDDGGDNALFTVNCEGLVVVMMMMVMMVMVVRGLGHIRDLPISCSGALPRITWTRHPTKVGIDLIFPTIFIDIHMYQNISKGGSSLELRGVLSV